MLCRLKTLEVMFLLVKLFTGACAPVKSVWLRGCPCHAGVKKEKAEPCYVWCRKNMDFKSISEFRSSGACGKISEQLCFGMGGYRSNRVSEWGCFEMDGRPPYLVLSSNVRMIPQKMYINTCLSEVRSRCLLKKHLVETKLWTWKFLLIQVGCQNHSDSKMSLTTKC